MSAAWRLAWLAILSLACVGGVSEARAHSLDFGVLRIVEGPAGTRLSLRAGGSEGAPPAIDVEVSGSCAFAAPPSRRVEAGLLVMEGALSCPDGLEWARVRVSGLTRSHLSVLLRVERRDGTVDDVLLDAERSTHLVRGRPGAMDVLVRYGWLGAEHIGLGLDHLLFVLALILVVFDPRARRADRSPLRSLLFTVTGFTLGHSLTLSLAALGAVSLPSAPVEACIALSIVLLAAELSRGPAAVRAEAGWTFERPWLVAAVFGLLHGLGFAGALRELGLPSGSASVALIGFNLGVELGQLVFVALALPVLALAARVPERLRPRVLAGYAIGVIATVWLAQRLDALAAAAGA